MAIFGDIQQDFGDLLMNWCVAWVADRSQNFPTPLGQIHRAISANSSGGTYDKDSFLHAPSYYVRMRPLLRNLMQGILLTVVLLLAVMVTRAMGLKSSLVAVTAVEVEVAVDEEAVARRLAKALRFVMVSPQDEKDFKAKPFEELREWLRVTYPKSMLT
jgi:hypothetical protein